MTGRPAGPRSKRNREVRSQRTEWKRTSAGRLELQTERFAGDAASAHAPPVDEKFAGQGDGDLLGAAGMRPAHSILRPDDRAVRRLEFEQPPRRFLAPEAQPGAAVLVDGTELAALGGGGLTGRQPDEAAELLARLAAAPVEHLAFEGAGGEGADTDGRRGRIGLDLSFDLRELL